MSPSTIRVWHHHRGLLTRYGSRAVARWDLKELAALLVRGGLNQSAHKRFRRSQSTEA